MNADLELDSDGNVKVAPLVGYRIQPVADMFCFLRLEFAPSDAELKTMTLSHNQLALTPQQCRELSSALLRVADLIEHQSVPERSS
jgi:hypothetical protein